MPFFFLVVFLSSPPPPRMSSKVMVDVAGSWVWSTDMLRRFVAEGERGITMLRGREPAELLRALPTRELRSPGRPSSNGTGSRPKIMLERCAALRLPS